MRVAVLSNPDQGLAHGEAIDRIAVQGGDEAARAVAAACRENGWQVVRVAVTKDPAGVIADLGILRPDVVFHLVEAVAGDARLEAASASLLEWVGVPYTGSSPRTLALALEKPLARAQLAAHGVPVPRGVVLELGDEPLRGLRWPCIVKPAREDASHGISAESVVADEGACRARAMYLRERYAQPALVEEFVDGPEFNVSFLGSGERAEALPLSRIDFSGFPPGRPPLVTYEAKWVPESADYRGTLPSFPDDLDPSLAERVRSVAIAAYRALGVRDYGRVDLRVHREAGPLVLDVNPNPDPSPDAGLARAAAKAGMTYARLVRRIVEDALARAPSPPPRV
jgi:D-alanine-D-alanine ligase